MLGVHCQSNVTVDDKGRLALPKPIRAALSATDDGRLVLLYSGSAIWAYTPEEFAKRVEAPLAADDPFDEDNLEWVHALLATAQDLEVDGAGRVRLPSQLRELAGITRDVVVHSVLQRLEFWDKDAWTARFREVMANKAMRRRGLPKRSREVIAMPERR